MMKRLYTPLIAIGLLFTAGCGAGGGSHEQIAMEVCDCMRPLSEAYASIEAAREKDNAVALERFVEEMEAAHDELDACASLIEERYGVLEGRREEGVKAAMQKICPGVIATLNEAEAELVQ